MPPRPLRRSLQVPGILLLSLSALHLGCGRSERAREEARREEAARRQREELQPPSPAVLEQLRVASQDYLTEHQPGLSVQGFSFTQLTPNLYLVGVNATDAATQQPVARQLSAERLRDTRTDAEGTLQDRGGFLWVIDEVDAARMQALAQRHGIAGEVDAVRRQHPDRSAWGHRSWLDDYLLWHFLFHRPAPMGYGYGSGFAPMAPGWRVNAPARPFREEDARPYQAATAPTGGRSGVFLSGQAWNPPPAHQVPIAGQAYGVAGPEGGITGKTGLGGVARGGFGAAGRGAAAGS